MHDYKLHDPDVIVISHTHGHTFKNKFNVDVTSVVQSTVQALGCALEYM